MESLITNIALPAGVILVIICSALFIISMMAGILQNIKGSLKLLVGVGVILVIFFISYAMASDANPTLIEMSSGNVKFVTAGIITMGALIVLTVVIAIGAVIYDIVK